MNSQQQESVGGCGGGQDKGIGFRVLLDAKGSFVPPSLSFFLLFETGGVSESLCPSTEPKVYLTWLFSMSALPTHPPTPNPTPHQLPLTHLRPSHLVHSAAFFFCRQFFSSTVVHQEVPTGCERVHEIDFQVLLKVEGFVIKDPVFSYVAAMLHCGFLWHVKSNPLHMHCATNGLQEHLMAPLELIYLLV